ncbi:ABC transporter ATP-binding protein [Conexibacter stalactiti]|uniref:ABC transporter ATP-binding protein n=1 Tax=Conexibacter stalactiti TaxID=1940611 RepID=UPI00298C20D8|nr:ATP-binding cassette domain-containing protein [Conexibacter stalactiti]
MHALNDVTLTVRRGELVALLGPSGAGKSTILWLASGIEAPTRGTVSWDGRDLAALSRRERELFRRETLGMLFQDPPLQRGVDAVGNVESRLVGNGARPSHARRAAKQVLVELGLGARLHHPPQKLSGGERRRVALSRALVNSPDLLLADEPTANLDTEHGALVLDRLRQEAHEHRRAVLMVTHDPAAAAIADRCLTLTDGRLQTTAVAAARPERGAR